MMGWQWHQLDHMQIICTSLETGGLLIGPDGMAPSRIVGVSSSDISHCTIKSRRSFLLAPAYPGSPGKRTIKRLCVYVSVWVATGRGRCFGFNSVLLHCLLGDSNESGL